MLRRSISGVCKDLDLSCKEFIRKNPLYCSTVMYSTSRCRKSCGLCDAHTPLPSGELFFHIAIVIIRTIDSGTYHTSSTKLATQFIQSIYKRTRLDPESVIYSCNVIILFDRSCKTCTKEIKVYHCFKNFIYDSYTSLYIQMKR